MHVDSKSAACSRVVATCRSKQVPIITISPRQLRGTQMARNTPGARYISPGTGAVGKAFGSLQKGIFRKDGAHWTVGYNRQLVRLRDVRGLGYIAHLLRHPGTELHVLDLYGGIAGQRDEDGAGQSGNGSPQADQD